MPTHHVRYIESFQPVDVADGARCAKVPFVKEDLLDYASVGALGKAIFAQLSLPKWIDITDAGLPVRFPAFTNPPPMSYCCRCWLCARGGCAAWEYGRRSERSQAPTLPLAVAQAASFSQSGLSMEFVDGKDVGSIRGSHIRLARTPLPSRHARGRWCRAARSA